MTLKDLLLFGEDTTLKNSNPSNETPSFSRLYYVIEGETCYREKGKVIRFKKNHLYLTPVNSECDLCDTPHADFLYIFAHVTTLPVVTRWIEIEVIDGTPLSDAVTLWRKYVPGKDDQLIASILQFLLSRIPGEHLFTNSVAQRAKTLLEQSNGTNPDMKEISRTLGYSREHITRCFYNSYGCTPRQYLNAQTMNAAAEKLKKGEKIKEVAYQAGYSSPFAFSKAFKKHFGASPQPYLSFLRSGDPCK